MSFITNDRFITGGLRVLGITLSFLSILFLGMWVYSVFIDDVNDVTVNNIADGLIGFVGAGAIGFFLLALARLIEIGAKIADRK